MIPRPMDRVLSAKIAKAESRNGTTLYVIRVHSERGQTERKWTIRRGFSDFENLHKELTQLFSPRRSSLMALICGADDGGVDAPSLPRFPARRFWANTDSAFIQKRGGDLNTYLGELVCRPAFAECSVVLNFFRPEKESDVISSMPGPPPAVEGAGTSSNLGNKARLTPPPLRSVDAPQTASGASQSEGDDRLTSEVLGATAQTPPKAMEYSGMLNVDEECAMCCEDFTEAEPAVLTGCNHKFHLHCIIDWKDRNTKPLCPMCRRDLTFKDETMREELAKDEMMNQMLTSRMSEADEEMARRLQSEEMGGFNMAMMEAMQRAASAGRSSSGRRSGQRSSRSAPGGRGPLFPGQPL